MASRHHRPFRSAAAVLALLGALVLAAAALAGCGDDDDGLGTGAQPGPFTTDFTSEALADIPVPDAADPLSTPTESDSVVAQSFEIPGQTPQQVVNDFVVTLSADGWETASGPEEVGTSYRAEFLRGDEVLEVSANPLDESTSDTVVSQFNLVLRTGS